MKAVYPGSFDPVTNGHIDIVHRASRIFDGVIVAVYEAPPKNVLFTAQERVALFRGAVNTLDNVEVTTFNGLTVDVAREAGAGLIIRGLRAGSDFENEFEMFLMNKNLAADVEAVYMMSNLQWQFLSSARVKEIAQLGADVRDLVPPHVAAALATKLREIGP
ncbi:MAG: pantetheine-phosphate adenylyltransferase [SAR202 cluster bacterium]|nr:pantetheine-phosphate adenylyltransferase [SAR202 cluster bacterium]